MSDMSVECPIPNLMEQAGAKELTFRDLRFLNVGLTLFLGRSATLLVNHWS
jgi:hypothetical protein